MILEYRKGYLFVRFNNLDINTNKLIDIIKSDNLYNIVVNLNLTNVNYKIINLINLLNKMVNKNNGVLYICGVNKDIFKTNNLNKIKIINNELDAFRIGETI